MSRLDWVLAGLVVLATFTVVFMVGVAVSASGVLPWREEGSGPSAGTSPGQQALPQSDSPGKDMPNVERYPRSVRVKYERYDFGEMEVVEVGYLTDARMENVGAFYESLTRDSGWRTAGYDVSKGDELGMLITRGGAEDGRRVLIEIEPRGELVSVELEEMVAGSR